MLISDQASEFLLELYHDAAALAPNELRPRTLRNLQRILPFDFAVWGGGVAAGRLVTDLVVLDHSEAILGEWDAVADRDAFCDLTLAELGTTARFDDVPQYRASLAYNEHWRRFDASHMMATIVAEQTDGYVSFVGLCAEQRPNPFSGAERMLKQCLMPHLSQALRMNRQLWTSRFTMDDEAVALVGHDGIILASQGPFHRIAARDWGDAISRIPLGAIETLHRCGKWFGASLDAKLSSVDGNLIVHLRSRTTLLALSPREREVARLYASGKTYKQVARLMGTSPSTVRNQIVRIYDKLEISNKAALAALIG